MVVGEKYIVTSYLSIIISVIWRRRIGIEPIYDSVSAVHSGLKSGAPTSDASISVNNNSALGVCNFSCLNLYANLYAN